MCLTTKQDMPSMIDKPVRTYKLVLARNCDGEYRLYSYYYGYVYKIGEPCVLDSEEERLFRAGGERRIQVGETDVEHGFHSYAERSFAEKILKYYSDTDFCVALLECEIPAGSYVWKGVDGLKTRGESWEEAMCYCSDTLIPIRWKLFSDGAMWSEDNWRTH